MSAELARALRALDDIKKIENQGVRVAEIVAGRLRQAALRQYSTGVKFFAGKIIMDQLLPVLMKAMVVGHAAGVRRSELLMKQSRIKLAIFDDVLRTLKARKKLDVQKLLDQYEVQAFKVLTGVSAKADDEIQTTIDELIASGAPVREATRTLGVTFEKLGIAPGSSSRLETIFRTQLQTSFGAGRWQADQDPDIQEILWGYKYVTVGDERVREEHAALEGVTLPKEDPFWLTYWPPNGWNCRCQAIPVFEERAVKRPEPLDDGTMPRPDPGFGFNAGEIFDDASLEFGWVPQLLLSLAL